MADSTLSPLEHPPIRSLIADAGRATQALGAGRVVGEIYAYLYFSRCPRSLRDLEEALAISKGSASMGVRRLERWAAVRRISVPGQRKDFYAAELSVGRILREAVAEILATKLNGNGVALGAAAADLPAEDRFLRERIRHLATFRDQARKALEDPTIQRLLR
mgnify:CR=1 FL=1